MQKSTAFMSTTACLMMATASLAQTSTDQNVTDGGRTADKLTCADIVTMDTATVPGVLYFVAGYEAGNKSGMDGAATQSTETTSVASSGSTDTTGAAATADTATDMTGTATDMTGTRTTTAGNDTATADSGTTTSTDTSQSADSSSGSDTSASATDKMHLMRVTGLYQIPVEKIMTVCKNTPDDKLGDVMKKNKDMSTGTSN